MKAKFWPKKGASVWLKEHGWENVVNVEYVIGRVESKKGGDVVILTLIDKSKLDHVHFDETVTKVLEEAGVA